MITAFDLASLTLNDPVLLTIGTFDGMHRGHAFLLEQAAGRAHALRYQLAIVTFDPCPAVVLRPSVGRYQLTTAGQKLRLLAPVNPALVAVLPFSLELAQLTADQFLDLVEARLTLRELWMGEDFHFGRDRQGGLDLLMRRGASDGFAVHAITRRVDDHRSISSSRVRERLLAGDVQGAIPLLGRPFALDLSAEGCNESGQSYTVAPHLLLPRDGWYAALGWAVNGESSAAAVRVQQREDYPVTIVGAQRGRLRDLEFVARLDEPLNEPAAQARALLEQWRRPDFPAASNY